MFAGGSGSVHLWQHLCPHRQSKLLSIESWALPGYSGSVFSSTVAWISKHSLLEPSQRLTTSWALPSTYCFWLSITMGCVSAQASHTYPRAGNWWRQGKLTTRAGPKFNKEEPHNVALQRNSSWRPWAWGESQAPQWMLVVWRRGALLCEWSCSRCPKWIHFLLLGSGYTSRFGSKHSKEVKVRRIRHDETLTCSPCYRQEY